MLPFGADLLDHTVPNSFMLRPDVGFTMLDQSVALDDWDPAAVQESAQQAGVPTHDVYGAPPCTRTSKRGWRRSSPSSSATASSFT